VRDLSAFRTAFLPAVRRAVHRYGIEFHHIRYWHDGLAHWVGRSAKVVAHYDPADLSRLYVRLPDATRLEVPYQDLRRPPIALWECDAAAKYLRRVSRMPPSEERLFAAIAKQREIVQASQRASRKARRETARAASARHTREATQPAKSTPSPESPLDYSKPVEPYPSEIWPPRRRW
jgi:putative transposase